jgi:hypothetical protein
MAWSPPRSWQPGEIPTAEMFNAHIRDNLAFLKDPPTLVYTQYTSISTSSTVFTSMGFNWAFQNAGGRLMIGMSGGGYYPAGSTPPNNGRIDFSIDGTQIGSTVYGAYAVPFNTVGSVPFSFVFLTEPYAAGTHTIVPLFKTDNSAFSIPWHHLWIREVS